VTVRVSEGRYLEILAAEPAVGVPLEFEVYDGANPATLLAVLEQASEGQIQLAMGDVGAGRLTLPRRDPKAAHLAAGNLVRAKIGGIARAAFWVEDPVEVLTSAQEGGGEVVRVQGRGPLAYLERAVVYPPVWPPQPAAYVAAASGDNGAGSTQVSCPRPTGTAAGDLLIAAVVVLGGSDVTLSTPGGWTLLERRDSGNDVALALFARPAASGDPGSWAWSFSDSRRASAAIVAIRNASSDPTAYAVALDTGTGTAIGHPSVNVGLVDGMLLTVAATTAATTIAPPAGMAEVAERSASGRTIEIAVEAGPPLGDTGDRTSTAGAAGSWIGVSLWVPSSARAAVDFVDETPGGILVTLLERAQARGAIPLATWDFDATTDSGGQPWTVRHTLTFAAGTSLLDVWRHLVSLGLEGEMTPSLRLRAFVDMSRHFEDQVILRKARHLLGDVQRLGRQSDLRTRLLVEGSGGRIVEITDVSLEAEPRVGRREGYLQLGTSDDPTVLQQAGLAALEAARLDDEARQVPVAHGIGPGQYEPFIHYRLGDWIGLDAGGTGDVDTHRIVGLTIAQTQGGDYAVELDLNSVALEREARLARLLDQMSRGSAPGSAAGLGVGGAGGAGGGGTAEAGKVAVTPGDTAGYLQDKLGTGTGVGKSIIQTPIGRRLLLSIDPTTIDHGQLHGLSDDDHTQYVLRSILQQKGDLFVRTASGIARLPVGSDGQVLTADAAQAEGMKWATPSGSGQFIAGFDGGGSVPSAGAYQDVIAPFNGTITGWTILADQSGSAVIDVRKGSYASYPPATSITGGSPPTLSSANKAQGSSTGWTTSVSAGDIIRFYLSSASTVTKLLVVLAYTRT
jgi:hypothetical protein